MLRIVTLNINGLRSGLSKGFAAWVVQHKPDILCLQEIRVDTVWMLSHEGVLPGYQVYYCCAEKKGYSGVAIYIRKEIVHEPVYFDDFSFNHEGRLIGLRFQAYLLLSIYFPSGSSGEERQQVKFDFLEKIDHFLVACRQETKEVILCGDWNIAHHEIDLKNWRANRKHSGFLPEERDWLTRFLEIMDLVDVFRYIHPSVPGYTWWSQRQRAFEKDVGWRIDYQVVTPSIIPLVRSAWVDRMACLSDHAPLIVDYDLLV